MSWKKFWIGTLIVMVAGLGFYSFNRDQKNFEIAKNLEIYYSLFRELNTFYVDDVNPNKLVKTSIDEMLQSLDPYTNYISEDQMEDFRFMTTGEYAGIGALIGLQNGKIVISEPYEGFPAQKFGLKAGDVILEVEGKSTEKMTTQDVSNLLKGPAKKPVKIKLQRPGKKKPFEVDVVREKISIDAVPYYGMLDNNMAYIRLSNFTANCSEDVKKAFLELKENNPEGLVLDMRSNPGGLLQEAVKIVNFFVPEGSEIVSTKGKVTQWDKTYTATSAPLDTAIRIAVLTNGGSASASEIVAGAIQDLDRGLIIGSRTFGKGLVQTTRDLAYNSKLKVTTAKYYIPSGRCIQALDYSHRNEDGSVGIVPDSLISEFSTKKGRKVYDGGGIVPDIVLKPEQLSNLSAVLITNFLIFDFATSFTNENASIAQPEEFEITDEIYNQFSTFVKSKEFEYESQSKHILESLIEKAKEEKYYDLASDEFEAIKTRLEPHLDKDLNVFGDEVKSLLKNEIVSRYYYQKGAIRSSLNEDKVIEKAVDELGSQISYTSHFEPGIIITMKRP
ncbi:C-terminal processing peptidase-3. Serine peptidase. MEROPS family S41A [Mariniphaga anaerophila]|uniref:C-terminal processing peptidase-3. Serine peptidase. MEROPS family S41A n=1 Tax=Mariniphaga anaerophila TaxID=1484053 RepID=A0A1M5BS59_9BACT|nr:S41 family peptidase [Mariniphaga anaerophila]SHF45369.1 C-terminal processing peptidase-3. Serine peptidase. MEROPS family S41A [Mariniphaga anaerophila]